MLHPKHIGKNIAIPLALLLLTPAAGIPGISGANAVDPDAEVAMTASAALVGGR